MEKEKTPLIKYIGLRRATFDDQCYLLDKKPSKDSGYYKVYQIKIMREWRIGMSFKEKEIKNV